MTRAERDARLAALPKEKLVAMLGLVHDLLYRGADDELDPDTEWDWERFQYLSVPFEENGIDMHNPGG